MWVVIDPDSLAFCDTTEDFGNSGKDSAGVDETMSEAGGDDVR